MVCFSETLFRFGPLAEVVTDLLAFLVVVVFAVKSRLQGFKMPSILWIIVQDSTVYFLLVFTTHLVLEMMLLFARVNISIIGDRIHAETPFSSQIFNSCQLCKLSI